METVASGDFPGSLRSLLQKNQGKTFLKTILAVGASPAVSLGTNHKESSWDVTLQTHH